MFKNPTLLAIGFVLIALLDAAVSKAELGVIRDNGAFFSESAKSQATRKITDLKQQYKKDIVIETFTEIPDDIKKGVDLTDKAAMSRLYEQWTVSEAKLHKVNGVFILLSKEPAHIQVVVGNETQKKAFTIQDRNNLTSLMLSKLRNEKYDEALLEGVNFVSTTIASHATPNGRSNNVAASASPASSPAKSVQSENGNSWVWIIIAVMGVGAVWLIVGVIRSMMGGRASTAGAGMAPGYGGGGMFGSLLGGMFGAAAGMWLYDQFSGSHSNAWGADQDNRGVGTGFSGEDTDYSGTGSDFGGDSGGGDFGGDAGGGGGDF